MTLVKMTREDRLLCQLLKWLFTEYESHKVEYCILRNYHGLPENNFGSDIDILIKKKKLRKNQCIIKEMLSVFHINIFQIIKRQYVIQYIFYKNFGNKVWFLQIDFHTNEEWRGAPYLTGKYILAHRRYYKKGFYIPSQVHEAIILWLSPVLMGGIIKKGYKQLILQTATLMKNEFVNELELIFGHKTATALWGYIEKGKLNQITKCRNDIRRTIWWRSFNQNPAYLLKKYAQFFWYEIRLRIYPGGSAILIEGKNESKEKKIAKDLLKILNSSSNLRRNFLILYENDFSGKLYSLLKKNQLSKKNHQRALIKSILPSLSLIYYGLYHTLLYVRKVRPKLYTGQMILMSSFFQDFLNSVPNIVRRFFYKFSLTPDLTIHLVNSLSNLCMEKYKPSDSPNLFLLNASETRKEIARMVVSIILEHARTKTIKMYENEQSFFY